MRAHGRLRYAVDLPSDLRVIIGRDNWLFLNGDGTIEQATGKLLREAAIATFADRAAALRAHLAAKGARLLVAIPPNGATINRARLPAWAAEAPAVTEYDLMMRALAERGVAAVDLRAAADGRRKPDLPAHRHALEQVWRARRLQRGGAARHASPNGSIDPARVLRGFEPVEGGDLARLLAIAADVTDEDAVIDLGSYGPPPPPRRRDRDAVRERRRSGRDRPRGRDRHGDRRLVHARLLAGLFRDCMPDAMSGCITSFAASSGRVLDEHAPQLVILAPTERQMFCAAAG